MSVSPLYYVATWTATVKVTHFESIYSNNCKRPHCFGVINMTLREKIYVIQAKQEKNTSTE